MITASLVKELREKTGAGMMDCKKVLTETDGDMEKAAELLRERGITKAAKKSDRIAAEGLVYCYLSEDKKLGIPVIGLVDTNCSPVDVDYPIPGNDDAIRAVKLITDVMANAVIEGKQGEILEDNSASEVQESTSEPTDMEEVVAESAE